MNSRKASTMLGPNTQRGSGNTTENRETQEGTHQPRCFASSAERMRKINLSFAACGFLGIYHLGAAAAFCRHGQKLLKDVKAFAGASAGSLVASVLLTAPEKLQECDQFTYKLAEETRSQSLGAMTPGYDFMARLRNGMELILPPNAHELAQNRLHVSITNTKTRENYLVSDFPSREDLIKHMQPRPLGMDVQDLVSEKCLNGTLGSLSVAEATHFPKRGFAYKAAKSHICLCKVLLASSFVPVYTGLRPVEYQGQKWVDGGLTNSLPVLPMGRTVTISPFCGRLDICPQDRGQLDLYLNITNQDIMLSLANLVRLNQALFPPSKRKMESLYQSGFNDTVKFLRKENWFE